jgi:hypothetical protein
MNNLGTWIACAATGVAVAVSGASCAGTAERQLSHAAHTVDGIRSGVMDMRLMVTSSSEPPFGFTIRGPFALGPGDLRADLRYTQVAGAAKASVRYVASDGRAFVVSEGAFYELPMSQAGSAVQAPTVLDGLGFDEWATAPRLIRTGSSRAIVVVSPVRGAASLFGIARVLDTLELRDAAGLTALGALGEETLERVVRGGTMTVRIREEDGLLRALVVRLHLRLDLSPGVSGSLAAFADAQLVFSVRITRPNEPVRIRLSRVPRRVIDEQTP